MSLTFLLLAVIPIIAFVVVDAFSGLKAGVVTAMVLAVLTFAANWYLVGAFEPSSVAEPALILILGLASLRFADPRYIRFQPVAVDVSAAIVLAYYQFFSVPLLQKYHPITMKLLGNDVPPEVRDVLQSADYFQRLGSMSHHLIYLALAHAALVGWVGLRMSNWWWLAARLAIYPMLIIFMIVEHLM